MKKVTPELLNHLHTKIKFQGCDLYEIRLFNGQTFRYADYGMDIALNDGRVFSSQAPIFARGKIQLSAAIEVDKMNITLQVDETDRINDYPIMQIAHNGGLDDATLYFYRCFMNASGAVVGVIEFFSGNIDVKSGGGLELVLEIKSSVQLLNVNYPLRKYYPSCSWQVYGAGCGLNLAAFTNSGVITQTITSQEFYTNLSFADGYYDQGVIEWQSGILSGQTSSVKHSRQANGTITILIPPETSPAAGDSFRIYPGCDKTPETCRNKFNNFLRNRATPYIPLKETIV